MGGGGNLFISSPGRQTQPPPSEPVPSRSSVWNALSFDKKRQPAKNSNLSVEGDEPHSETSKPASWRSSSRRAVKAATKGMSYLFWGGTPPALVSEPIDYSESELPARPAVATIKWTPVTYQSAELAVEGTSEAVIGFVIHRSSVMTRRSRIHTPSAGKTPPPSTNGDDAATPPSGTGSPESSVLRPTVSTSDLCGTGPASVVKQIGTRGIIVVKPTAVEKYTREGLLTNRMNMVPEISDDPPKQTTQLTLLQTAQTNVLGIGSLVICTTNLFKVIAIKCEGFRLIADFDLSVNENRWRRYLRGHAARPTPDSLVCPTALLSPSCFARRTGMVVCGTSSGLVHIWRLPDVRCEVLLPSPLPLGEAVPVVALAHQYANNVVDEDDEVVDCASPVAGTSGARGDGHPGAFLWSIYGDGRLALWKIKDIFATNNTIGPPICDRLAVAKVDGPDQYHFPEYESPLCPTEAFENVCIFDWRQIILEVSDSRSADFLNEVDSVQITCDGDDDTRVDAGLMFLLIRSRSQNYLGDYALATWTPVPQKDKMPSPFLIDFRILREVGVPGNPELTPCIAHLCKLQLLQANKATCLLLAFGEILRVIRITDTKEDFPIGDESGGRIQLSLLANYRMLRRSFLTSMKYEADFDELLIGLATGELVAIPRLAAMLRKSLKRTAGPV